MSHPSGVRAGANDATRAASKEGSMKRVWVATGEAILSDRLSEPGGSKSAVEPGSSKTRAEAENGSGIIVNVLISFGRPSARELIRTVVSALCPDSVRGPRRPADASAFQLAPKARGAWRRREWGSNAPS